MSYSHNDEFVEVDPKEMVGSELDNDQHLTKDMFTQVQRTLMDIDVTASLAELEQNPSLATWKLMPHLSKEFKQNLALKNRHLATGEELAGNLNRCIPLHLEILQQKNSFPVAMGIHVPGMMDKNLYKHGQCVYRVPPDTQTMLVGQNVFEPTNKITQWMYDNYRMCTVEDLETDIKHFAKTAKVPAHATIAVGSLAHEALKENLAAGKWQSELEHIDVEEIFDPKMRHTVQVTPIMAKQIAGLLEPMIKETADSFINLEDFNVKIVRADGQANFAAPQGIHGELIGSNVTNAPKIVTDKLQTRYNVTIKAALYHVNF